jgi:hypothetical protein
MIKRAFPTVCLISVLLAGVVLADPFEATKWKIKVSPDEDARKSGAKDFDEVLIFKGSQFTAQSMEKRGFKPVQYEEDTRRFGPASFKAEQESDKEGKARWTGVITATTMKGELVWTKKDGTEMNYSYTGERDDSR